ncbi:hypothetical protein [Solimonas sp. SE-A11]|uniref:hypothetical protein n=1 Tax=Solimonas sp. SE-A11 TaxID=3054954 RepID=UPI00259CEC50|nr:hypothetical protein [Solimonas sp. SE-A11]MDM4772934.1 hypothetical protein [Solimonas sp. SE-A11]
MAAREKILDDFSAWAALSAMRSGAPVKSATEIYGLLDPAIFKQLFHPRSKPISAREFGNWHRTTTAALMQYENLCEQAGWAAKLLNVYLKAHVYIGGAGRKGLIALIHPPVDSGLWRGVKTHCKEHKDPKPILERTHVVQRISQIQDYETYLIIIEGLRMVAAELGCPLIEVEQLWDRGRTKLKG